MQRGESIVRSPADVYPQLSLGAAFPAAVASKVQPGQGEGLVTPLVFGCWGFLGFFFFWVHGSSVGSYSALGEVSLVTGGFCSHLAEAKQADYICLLIKIFLMKRFFFLCCALPVTSLL